MCGIVYIKRKDGKPANRSVRKRYYKQKFRGTSGFGYVAVKDNKVVSYQRAPTEHEIMGLLQKETAPEILFHHRFPTSTPNMEEQAHPLFISGGGLANEYYIAHNGVIRNPSTRKVEHEALGFKYLTELKPFYQSVAKKLYNFGEPKFNDSEALAVDTALALEGKVKHIESEGASAVVGFTLQGDTVVDRFFYRNHGNPLMYKTDQTMTTITSGGSGAEVETIWVMRLKEDGLIEEHPLKVWSPWVYRNVRYGTPIQPALPAGTIHFEDREEELPVVPPKKDALLASLPTEKLWEEYEKVTLAKIELERDLKRYDESVEFMGTMNVEVLDGRERIEGRLGRIKTYYMRLEDELTKRESTLITS